jgi:UDP-N-acetylmuramyl pentapeptide phosphotransferase/UDP-N-acetylglucosamine-1-phosphate transferase
MVYFIFSLVLLLTELIYFRLAGRFNIIDKPNQRSSHSRITPRGGGIVFYFGALMYFIGSEMDYPLFFTGLTIIAAVSMADDVRTVNRRARLLIHFLAIFLMFFEWKMFPGLPGWYMLIALVVCTGIINAFNFMDGINGMTGGYSLVAILTMSWVNTQYTAFINQAFLNMALLSVLVFNFFNFRRKARCFAGDTGSVSIAFIILFALGNLVLKTKDLSYIIFLAVYGVDSVLTIIHRIIRRENIFEAHRKHAYQVMANELKIPHIRVAALYMILQAVINAGFLLLASSSLRLYYLVGILMFLGLIYVLFMKRFFNLHLQDSCSSPTGSRLL